MLKPVKPFLPTLNCLVLLLWFVNFVALWISRDHMVILPYFPSSKIEIGLM
jgi:hypothetical protein